MEREAANTGKVLVIGHRGARGRTPENKMASFRKAAGMGVDEIGLTYISAATGT